MMDKSREQFEAWFNSKSNWKIVTTMRTKTGYTNNPSAQSKWEVWQASRAAVEIELPQTQYYGDHWSGDWALDKDSVEEVLTEQGLKVKQ